MNAARITTCLSIALTFHGLRLAAADRSEPGVPPLERLLMMWPLAREAWKVAGRKLPDYSRNQTPVKLLRGKPLSGR